MARPLTLPLFPEEAPPRRPPPSLPVSPPRKSHPQLWLALHLPRLSLEALPIPPGSREPLAVIAGEGRNARVLDCTQDAAARGVQSGMPVNAAMALEPALRLLVQEPVQEQAALARLAEVAYGFTPSISLEPPSALLLEVAGSAHLFDGPQAIRARVKDAFKSAGFTAVPAVAPTPLAALWLATAQQEMTILRQEELRSTLGRLPVRALTWGLEQQDSFERLGIRHLVDLFRLPREGLAKRFGPAFLEALDRATGEAPDPRAAHLFPKRLHLRRELPAELSQMAYLQPHIESLVAELTAQLRRHDAAVDRIKLLFRHWHQAPTAIIVGGALPHRDESGWVALIQNRLANCVLAAPVLEVELRSGRLLRYTAESRELVGIGRDCSADVARLVDLLRARLGRTAVFGVAVTPDARPEQAWRSVEPGSTTPGARSSPSRPLTLLKVPQLLRGDAAHLRYRGAALKLMRGPERIEGGWWEGEAWSRDYYQALSSRGELLWLFREHQHWYLHGLFS